MATQVKQLSELLSAISEENNDILITSSILIPHSITLAKGVRLRGQENKTSILSFSTSDGIALNKNNTLADLIIQTSAQDRAIYVSSTEEDLGTMTLSNLTVTGQVQLLTRTPNKTMNLLVDHLDIPFSDSRNRTEKPLKYGAAVQQGALTVYNYNQDPTSSIHATIRQVSIGRQHAPVLGSGVFIAGFNETGGSVQLEELITDDIYSNGMIPFGQPNLITGGIFILTGAAAKSIHSKGSVTTYGVNDMVLDVWGNVGHWITEKPIKSYGTSGIGFVNFGKVEHFHAKEEIVTYGSGARGFNQYDGTIDYASFKSITTHGDGSIGMQISKPVGEIQIEDSITTYGNIGESLVKGEIKSLKAIAFSLQTGGKIKKLHIGGNIETNGQDVHSLEIKEGSNIESLQIDGQIRQKGNSKAKILLEATLPEDIRERLEK